MTSPFVGLSGFLLLPHRTKDANKKKCDGTGRPLSRRGTREESLRKWKDRGHTYTPSVSRAVWMDPSRLSLQQTDRSKQIKPFLPTLIFNAKSHTSTDPLIPTKHRPHPSKHVRKHKSIDHSPNTHSFHF